MREKVARLAGGVTVAIDPAPNGDWYCEARREADGTFTILDSYKVPREEPKPPEGGNG